MPEAGPVKVAILVGIIKPVLLRVQQYFERRIAIRAIPMAKNSHDLLLPPTLAKGILERHADEAPTYEDVIVVVSPYCRVHRDVCDSIDTLTDVGARVVRMRQGVDGCPRLTERMDATFQEALAAYIVDQLTPFCVDPTEDKSVTFELLRGLVSHDKMGSNNHSHEDDLWRNRGVGLRPNQRRRIEKQLMDKGILARKKNKSRGGTGWVYWIEDVGRAFAEFPDLAEFAGQGTSR